MIRRPDVSSTAPAAIAAGGNIGSASTTHIGTQVLGVSAVPVAAAVKDPGPIFTEVGVDSFSGREWLVGEVDRFMTRNPCGYVFIEAEAGLGKTAFAAWLVKTHGYVSHFSRYYSGGRLMRVALQNLSAQLVRKFGLDDLAPGGMLPEWAQTPSGFEEVLGKAAARAREGGRRLVLVVDGLDEAEPSDEALSFGLPTLLPDGAYVVGTYRIGRSPGRPDSPAATIRIGKDDQHNRRDIREFLTKAAAEETLAAKLAEANMDPADFGSMLAERCEGVWVYLRYVLQELRTGPLRPDTISNLPSGLRDYYTAQLRRWQKDTAWDEALLPLLATLGVAEEPLPATVLARLAGDLDARAVRRWCDVTFRPLLTTTRALQGGAPWRYEIYHASFREVLSALPEEQSIEPGGGLSYELEVLADELRLATVSAHARIADTYLSRFGGLHSGLMVLADNPAAAEIDDGYPLRHLVRHLQYAGRHDETRQLLAAEYQMSSGIESNVWFAAHDHANCLVSYLDDLERVRNAGVIASDRALAENQPAAGLGAEIRYALMGSSIASRIVGISKDLLELLIRTGTWVPSRGLDHARRIIEPMNRFDALIVVIPHLSTAEQPAIAREALAAAKAITHDYSCARALTALAPHLPAKQLPEALAAATAIPLKSASAEAITGVLPYLPVDQQEDAVAQALAAVTAEPMEQFRAWALNHLSAHLPTNLLTQAFTIATAINDEFGRAVALTGLAAYLPAELLAKAFEAAVAITSESYRAQALKGLARHLPSALQDQLLATALAITDNHSRAMVLTALVPLLPLDQRTDVLAQAMTAAIETRGDYRAQALTALARLLPPDQRTDVLAQAMTAATAIGDRHFRSAALTALARLLPPDQKTEALALALDATASISEEKVRASDLATLAGHLPANLLAKAVEAAAAITNRYDRSKALTGLAPHLPMHQQGSTLAEALAAATAIGDDVVRAWTLSRLASSLPAPQQKAAAAKALAATTAITDTSVRALTLTRVASRLPADQREGAMAQILAIIATISDEPARIKALTALAPLLPAARQAHVLAHALTAATAISDERSRSQALAGLAPHLPADLLSQAFAAAIAITNDRTRVEALTGLVPHLPSDVRADTLPQVLAAVNAIRPGAFRDFDLWRLAPYLPADVRADTLAEDLAAVTTMSREQFDTGRLTDLPAHLRADVLAGALAEAAVPGRRFSADSLPADLQTLAAVNTIIQEFPRTETLIGPATRQRIDALAEALASATAITSDALRSQALTGLVPHLPADLLSQALAAATAISDDHFRSRALAGLAPHLPADLLSQALAAAIAMPNDYFRAEALSGLAPHLLPHLHPRALAAASAMDSDMFAANALSGLAPYLPADLHARALTRVKTMTGWRFRASVLTGLAPHMPADLLVEAIAATPKTSLETIKAILDRGSSILSVKDERFLDLLRACFRIAARSSCLYVIALMSSAIDELGGPGAIQEGVNAIEDVHRWWP